MNVDTEGDIFLEISLLVSQKTNEGRVLKASLRYSTSVAVHTSDALNQPFILGFDLSEYIFIYIILYSSTSCSLSLIKEVRHNQIAKSLAVL